MRHQSRGTHANAAGLCVGLLTGVGCSADTSSPTEVYPSRPIRVVVPFAAGGGTDAFARVMEEAIEQQALLPQPLMVLNLDGAGGTIGSRRVKDARPDGHTVLLINEAIVTAKYSGKATFGPEAFEPVVATGEVGLVVAVQSAALFRDLRALMQTAADRPDTVTCGANLGAPSHFTALLLEDAQPGARFRFVQIGGGAKRFAALRGGHVDVSIFSIAEYERFKPAGIRALAFLGAERHPAEPDLATAREQGFDLVRSNLFLWWVPKGTPSERIDRLRTALVQAMNTDAVRNRLAEMHCTPVVVQGEALRSRIDGLVAEMAAVAPPRDDSVPDFPAIVLAINACLVIFLAPRAWRAARCTHVADVRRRMIHNRRGLARAIVCLGLTAAFAFSLGSGWPGIRATTVVFVVGVGAVLSRTRRATFPTLGVVALSMGFGVHYLFTRVFVIDLP